MNPAQQKAAARAFVARWQEAEGNEDREARSFWIEFAQELLGIPNATKVLNFERRVKGRKIDVFYEDMGILIENKSRGCSLDEKYVRSKKVGAETPYEQGKWYADNLPNSVRPDWIITCNFDEIRIHNLNHANPGSTFTSVALEELPDMLYLFGFFTDRGNSRIEKEKQLSVKAGELVGKLYDELSKQYQNIEADRHEQRSLNVLIVRLVFLLYAEDSGLLAKRGHFYDYLKNVPPNRLRNALMELFDVLDTPENQRDPYLDPELAAFPYINGGLFTHEDIVIPNLTDQIKVDLLAEASAGFDWKDISPTIFGAAFESTLNPETRRSGGMHYTSPENIHKVIDPLFLDDLKAELDEIEGIKIERDRVRELRIFQRKIASLTFLDPAAGSHNFLTETYISLRKLELRVIENLQGDQTSFDLVDNPIMVNIGQFYAIEINDFAVSVGKTALWIAEQQMMEKTQELLPYQRFEFLPLKSIANSVCANALRIDWNDVLPAEKCSYLISNPPYHGARWQTAEQKEDIKRIACGFKDLHDLDYVCAWFLLAERYMRVNADVRCAFVSTNSIVQGVHPALLWKSMFANDVSIDFAYRSFKWNSEASQKAGVTCVIVGFSKCGRSPKLLFDELGKEHRVEKINGYLQNADSICVEPRKTPIDNAPKLVTGMQPRDGGNLILSNEERESVLLREPNLAPYIRQYIGADELLKGTCRYCYWLEGVDESIIRRSDILTTAVDAVRDFRLASKAKTTNGYAKTPSLFAQRPYDANSSILVVPKVSSEHRCYLALGYVDLGAICNDRVMVLPNATLYQFGVLSSRMHNAWMRLVAGRMESRYLYSAEIVYNNFVWPQPTLSQRQEIEICAERVLDVRNNHPEYTLAQMYDGISPLPEVSKASDKKKFNLAECSDLLAAHMALDRAVEVAYGVDFNGDEEKIVAHLFKLYAEMAGE